MDVNVSVEAAEDDPVIVVPWADPAGVLHYVTPQDGVAWIDTIAEAREWKEIREALVAIHATGSRVHTAKCDAWVLSEEERQLDFGPVGFGFGAYFDVLSDDRTPAELCARIDQWARVLQDLHAEARCDFVIRPAVVLNEEMYAVTVYVFGYGAQEQEARRCWAEALGKIAALLAGG